MHIYSAKGIKKKKKGVENEKVHSITAVTAEKNIFSVSV